MNERHFYMQRASVVQCNLIVICMIMCYHDLVTLSIALSYCWGYFTTTNYHYPSGTTYGAWDAHHSEHMISPPRCVFVRPSIYRIVVCRNSSVSCLLNHHI